MQTKNPLAHFHNILNLNVIHRAPIWLNEVAHLDDIVDKVEECEALVGPDLPRHLQPTTGDFVGVPPDYLKKAEIRVIFSDKHVFNLACSWGTTSTVTGLPLACPSGLPDHAKTASPRTCPTAPRRRRLPTTTCFQHSSCLISSPHIKAVKPS